MEWMLNLWNTVISLLNYCTLYVIDYMFRNLLKPDLVVEKYHLSFVNIALRSRDIFTAIWGHFSKIPMSLYILIRTSRLAVSLDFQPFFSQRNCQNTDLNDQNIYSGGPLKSQKRHQKMAKIVLSNQTMFFRQN